MPTARLTPIALALITLFSSLAMAEDTVSSPDEKSLTSTPTGQEAVSIDADQIEGSQDELIRATGDVQVQQQDRTITAPEVTYRAQGRQLEAPGPVCLRAPDATITGKELKIDADQQGTLQDASYEIRLPEQNSTASGTAEAVEFQGKDRYKLRNTLFTTCPIEDKDWYLQVDDLDLDKQRNLGVARDARLYFKNVPIGYLPYVDFPLNNARKTGFLVPHLGSSNNNGLEIEVPYYLNIAPNQDATITPRLMSDRGLQLNGEYRYLTESSNGQVRLELLPEDTQQQRSRSFAAVQHQQSFGSGLNGYLNMQSASDDEYFRDLGNSLNVASQTTLPREAGLTYNVQGWDTALRYQDFQVLQDLTGPRITPPYTRTQLVANRHLSRGPLQFNVNSEVVDFQHDELVEGSRAFVYPSVSMLVNNSFAYLKPKIGLHATKYQLDQEANALGLPDASRVLPITSIDSGLNFERHTTLGGTSYLQTLEPRLFYLYIPYQDQSRIPLFDTVLAESTNAQVITENRFSGIDRINDANQVTLSLSSQLLNADTGQQKLYATLAQRFNLERQRVLLNDPLQPPSATISPRQATDLFAVLGGELGNGWGLNSAVQVDTDEGEANRASLGVSYRPEPGKVVNMSYRYIQEGLEQASGIRQVDVSSQWPIRGNLYGLTRLNYSLDDSKVLEGVAGLEYNGGCWQLRTVLQHFTTGVDQSSNTIFVQLQLGEFTRVGTNPLSVLKRTIAGYTQSNQLDQGTTNSDQ